MNMRTETQDVGQPEPGFLKKCWAGRVPLWKGLILVNFLGLVLAFTICLAVFIANMYLLPDVKIFTLVLTPFIFFGYLTFNFVTLWRSSPNPMRSVKGALVKLWAVAFTGWSAGALLQFLGVPPFGA